MLFSPEREGVTWHVGGFMARFVCADGPKVHLVTWPTKGPFRFDHVIADRAKWNETARESWPVTALPWIVVEPVLVERMIALERFERGPPDEN